MTFGVLTRGELAPAPPEGILGGVLGVLGAGVLSLGGVLGAGVRSLGADSF